MKDEIHLLQFGAGDRRISFGTYDGHPALIIEPCEPREVGTFGMTSPEDRTRIEDGSAVLQFFKPESMAVLKAVVDDLIRHAAVAPTVARLSESACFVIEAAEQYGFTPSGNDDDYMFCTHTQLCNFIDAARAQGAADAEAARASIPLNLPKDNQP